jgi:acyl-CoA dehydrogenase
MYDRYFTEEHDQIRSVTRRFVKKEITPFVDEWEEAEDFPIALYEKAANVGILSVGYPENYGGIPMDLFGMIVVWEELMRCGSGGVVANLGSLHIALPPILNHGTDAQKECFLTPVLAGKKIAALGITEPGGGSDVANLKTTAVRDGSEYVVNGSKTFITNGSRADQISCAVRTGGEGHGGISLLVIEKGTPGFTTSKPLKKMGWQSSDTAALYFDACRVPVDNLIGEENCGFLAIMENFQQERLMMTVMANMTAQIALEESLQYVQQREAFGRTLADFQTIRHKLVDMATQVEVSREFAYRVAAKMTSGEDQVTQVSMAKNFACQVSDFVTYSAVQIFGGYGYMREYLVERLYRDNRILSIGGGTTEIMKEIISRRIL